MINTNSRPFVSKEVITRDEYGYPTLTRFYSGINQTGSILFEWAQVNSTTGITNLKAVKSKDVLTPPAIDVAAEAFTSSFDTAVALAHANIELTTVVVTSADGLTTYTEGTDYTIDYTTGTITVLKTTTNITNEVFTTGTALDLAIPLAHINLDSSVAPVVTSSDGLTTFTAGTDYTIDYANGTITVLSTGTMVVSTGYLIDYTYITGMLDATSYLANYKYMTSVTGDRYWIGGTGTIEWAGRDYQIAEWDGTAWVYTAVATSMAAYVTDLLLTFFYDGTDLKVLKEGIVLKWTLQNVGTGLA